MTDTQLFQMRRFGAGNPALRSLGKPAAAYPGRVATDSDLMIAVDRQQTRLVAPLDSVAASMAVQDPSIIVANNLLSIDSEIVKVTGAPVGNVVPISRAFDGTTAAVHLAGAVVSGFIDAYHHNALVAEVEAIEQTLGAHLSRIPASPFVVSTAFQFPAQSPGGSLIVGNNVITLSPVPAGVNGSDLQHYLYISGGTGTAEAVLITGGSAVAGAASGTVIVNCANPHSGAWTIQTATAGIQEAVCAAVNSEGGWYQAVQIPSGLWRIYAPISIDVFTGQTNIAIVGMAKENTIIDRAASFTTGNMIQNIRGAVPCSLTLRDLMLYQTEAANTSGSAIAITGQQAVNTDIRNVKVVNGWRGLTIDTCVNVNVNNFTFIQSSAWSANYPSEAAVTIQGGSAGNVLENIHVVADDFDTANMIHYGIHITGTDGLQVSNFDCKSRVGVFLDNSTAASAVANIKFDGAIIDAVREIGVLFGGSASLFLNIRFSNYHIATYRANTTHSTWGVFFTSAAATNVIFDCGLISGFATGGVGIGNAGVRNITIANSQIFDNGVGIQFGPGDGGTIIQGNRIYDSGGGVQQYAINIPSPVSQVFVQNNRLSGNTVLGINGASNVGSGRIEGNGGYNPAGTSPITVGASPFTYTAGASPEVVYVYGGTVTQIQRGGTTVASASPASVHLPPYGTMQVTYSAAPTMVRDIQ